MARKAKLSELLEKVERRRPVPIVPDNADRLEASKRNDLLRRVRQGKTKLR